MSSTNQDLQNRKKSGISENGTGFPISFPNDPIDIGDIQILGAEEELDTPLAPHPLIEVTEDKTRSLSPDFTPTYFSQDSLVASMQERGRPGSVSEMRNNRYKPPPRSQTMGDSSRYRRRVEHPHISIKVSPQLSKKRMSFLYRPQGNEGGEIKSRSQSLISNSSFQSALNDNFMTPFAKVLLSMRHIKDNLHNLEININREKNVNNNSLEDNNNNNNKMQIQNLMMIHNSIVELEDCFEIVESLESGKSIGESASE
eukprot:TRINITY_DN950_c0_g2_i2.p1 TRINITY_DN950_c0_g2~~TRINITY_DN950_c0_g2_i2.p1  ORF type:complete len:257 (-),score=61.53 TRINITY_DN950_c0_g2_i2:152-922(-)